MPVLATCGYTQAIENVPFLIECGFLCGKNEYSWIYATLKF